MQRAKHVAPGLDACSQRSSQAERRSSDPWYADPPPAGLWPNIVVSGHAPPCEGATDSDPSQQFAEALDRSLHYLISRFTLGLSPMARSEAYISG
jgi:hypothetical protein